MVIVILIPRQYHPGKSTHNVRLIYIMIIRRIFSQEIQAAKSP